MPENKPMPPPGGRKPGGLMIAIGMPKGGAKNQASTAPEPAPDDQPSNKMSAEDALVIREDKHCRNCANYMAESGECEKVDGMFSPDDACLRYFEPAGSDQDEPDADEQGGPSDADADEMQANAGAMA